MESLDDIIHQENPSSISRRKFVCVVTAGVAVMTTIPSIAFASPRSDFELTNLSLAQASAMVRDRRVSPIALTKACLDRIAVLDPKLNSFITVAEIAMSQAKSAEEEIARGNWRGPLHGIPIALKDNIDTAGIRTTAASAVFADRIPSEDAEVVKRLKAAGAIILGKLNMHEFAVGGTSVVSFWGPVHNPWALDRETGGSSGGSAAAIAGDLCFAALGTDTGGSIRVPAAHCSIVGLKPTYGRVSNQGVIPCAWSYDHVGPMCKTVEDAALVLQVIAGYDVADISTVNVPVPDYASALNESPKNLRLGIPRALFYDALEAEVRKAIEETITTLRPLVASIQDVFLPQVLDLPDAFYVELYTYHEPLFERVPELYQLPTAKLLKSIVNLKATRYITARRALEERRRQVTNVFEKVDVLITPTVFYTPRTIKYWQERDASEKPFPPQIWNTWLFNIFGLPAMSVPCGFSSDGLPIGLMIAGAPFAEKNVLTLGHAFEKATEWHKRKPQIAIE